MYNINYLTDLGTHLYTYTHPHFKSIYENQTKIKFNHIKSDKDNPDYSKYIENYTKTALEIGCKQEDIDYFINSIHPNCKKVPKGFGFSPAHPYFGPENSVSAFEHYSTIFTYLFINANKDPSEVDIYASPWSNLMNAAFLQPSFCGLLVHIHDTIDTFKTLAKEFTELYDKFIYFPLASPEAHQDKQPKIYKDRLNILFTNSFGGHIPNFRVRGGYEGCNAVLSLIDKYPNLHLTTIAPAPTINHPNVTQYQHMVDDDLYNKIMAESHVFLLPAMRIHTISLVKALCNGIVPIVSDGWGFDQYIEHGANGLVAKGQNGYTNWKDQNNILVEAYGNNAGSELTQNIVDQLVFLLENPDIYNTLSINCIEYAKKEFSIPKRNKILEDIVEKYVS